MISLRPEAGSPPLKFPTQVSSLDFPASPRRCPTPRIPLAGVNTFIDLLFLTLVLTATVSALLLLVELWETSRR